MIIARSQYDDRPVLSSDLSFKGDEGVTKQSDLKDCDINAMFRRFEKTGQLPDMILRDGRYGDFSEVPDYQEALNIVKLADEQFNALDVSIRNRFENDPAKFLEFATDPKNAMDMAKMGLLKPEVKKALEEKAAAEFKAKEAAGTAVVKEEAAQPTPPVVA